MKRVLSYLGRRATRRLRCSFCGRDEHSVRQLIAGPRVFICDGCTDACGAILRREREGPAAP